MTIYEIKSEEEKVNQVHIVFTGHESKIDNEEKQIHDDVYEYFKKKGKVKENGLIYRIVGTEIINGELLILVEKTNFGHFLAWNNRKDPDVEKIIGNRQLKTPCSVVNPQTGILAKPESIASKESGQSRAKQLLQKLRSKGIEIINGIMKKETVFGGTVQAFGRALSEKDLQKGPKGKELYAELKNKGFKNIIDNLGEEACYFDLTKILYDSLQKNAGLRLEDVGTPILLSPMQDKDGNWFIPHITPVHRTKTEIISIHDPEKSKFGELISLPADSKKASLMMESKNLKYKRYVPIMLDHIKELVPKNQVLTSFLQGVKTMGQKAKGIYNRLQKFHSWNNPPFLRKPKEKGIERDNN